MENPQVIDAITTFLADNDILVRSAQSGYPIILQLFFEMRFTAQYYLFDSHERFNKTGEMDCFGYLDHCISKPICMALLMRYAINNLWCLDFMMNIYEQIYTCPELFDIHINILRFPAKLRHRLHLVSARFMAEHGMEVYYQYLEKLRVLSQRSSRFVLFSVARN